MSVGVNWSVFQVGRSSRSVIDKFSVKKRLYIGRTTMDAQLSFVMANLAMVRGPNCIL